MSRVKIFVILIVIVILIAIIISAGRYARPITITITSKIMITNKITITT